MTKTTLALILSLLLLAGCTAATGSTSPPRPPSPAEDLRLMGAAIASGLTTSAGTALAEDATVVTTTFVEVDDLKKSSTLGRAVSGHVTSALTGLGYRVVALNLTESLEMRESVGELVLSRDVQELLEKRLQADALVTGTYYVTRNQVFVTSRLIDPATGDVLASHESMALLTEDLAKLLPSPEPPKRGPSIYFNR